jgi:hypothetical protein
MALLTKSTTSEGQVRLEDDKAYAAAAGKFADLEARSTSLEQRRSELSVGISRGAARRDVLTARAERLLQDDVVPLSSDAEMIAMRRDLGAVEDELAVTRRAVELQRPIVDRERQRVSRAICERLRPRHREIVGAVAAALKDLSAALADERALREELISADVTFVPYLRPMPLESVGTLDDENSRASVWMKDAREHGLIR